MPRTTTNIYFPINWENWQELLVQQLLHNHIVSTYRDIEIEIHGHLTNAIHLFSTIDPLMMFVFPKYNCSIQMKYA